jgi:hypothetical protein
MVYIIIAIIFKVTMLSVFQVKNSMSYTQKRWKNFLLFPFVA